MVEFPVRVINRAHAWTSALKALLSNAQNTYSYSVSYPHGLSLLFEFVTKEVRQIWSLQMLLPHPYSAGWCFRTGLFWLHTLLTARATVVGILSMVQEYKGNSPCQSLAWPSSGGQFVIIVIKATAFSQIPVHDHTKPDLSSCCS